jgi:hypothetical protein
MYAFFWLPQFPLAIVSTNMRGRFFTPTYVSLNDGVAWFFLVLDIFIFFGLFMWLD